MFMRPWILKGQWHLGTLSQHVQKFVKQNFAEFFQTGTQVTYSPWVLYPVFKLPDERVQLEITKPFVTIIGALQQYRRNYTKIFDQYVKVRPQVDLVLVGNGCPLRAPRSIKNNLIYKRGLEYPQYFNEISRALLILPSFATEHYVQSQASSTIATSVITVTPPLVMRQMLSAYAYLTEDAVWIQEDWETEVEAISRIAELGQDSFMAKKAAMVNIRANLINENKKTFEATLVALDEHVLPRTVTIRPADLSIALSIAVSLLTLFLTLIVHRHVLAAMDDRVLQRKVTIEIRTFDLSIALSIAISLPTLHLALMVHRYVLQI
ncbi:hypothetical protein V1504DRAFT_463755 [Lipomyces starkeyi]